MIRALFAASILSIAASLPAASQQTETAIFAGGCFWCVEADFDKVPGVVSTISGYTGGATKNPVYRNYESGGHIEAVKIEYDPAKVSYEKLLDVFFHSVDPTDPGGQFCDRGHGYTTAIYTLNEEQAETAKKVRQEAANELGRSIVTPIHPAQEFWPAEDYHQNYYRSEDTILSRFGLVSKAEAYKGYREGCGRDARLEELWGDAAMRGIEG